MKPCEYYRSTTPGFEWVFRIDKVHPSGAVAATYSDIAAYFTPEQMVDWVPATRAEFVADVSRSLEFREAWREDR